MPSVYEAVKAGMEAFPNVAIETGDPFKFASGAQHHRVGDEPPVGCCAIGFIYLGSCGLPPTPETEIDYSPNAHAYEHITTIKHRAYSLGTSYLYSWNDRWVSDFREGNRREPTHAEYLAALHVAEQGEAELTLKDC